MMVRSKVAALACLMLVLGAPRGLGAELLEGIAARVNGAVITESELRSAMAPLLEIARERHSGARLEREEASIRNEILDLLIDEELIVQKGRETGAQASEREIDAAQADVMARNGFTTLEQLEAALAQQGKSVEGFRQDLSRQILVMQVRGRELAKEIRITEGDIKRFYQEHESEFRVPESVGLDMIVVPLSLDAAAAAREREDMELLVGKLRAGELDFAAVARERSSDPSALAGGDLGRLTRGSMREELEAVVFALEPGKVADLVELDGRTYVFRVRDKEAGGLIPLEQIRDRIRGSLAREKEIEVGRRWLEDLRSGAFVERKYE